MPPMYCGVCMCACSTSIALTIFQPNYNYISWHRLSELNTSREKNSNNNHSSRLWKLTKILFGFFVVFALSRLFPFQYVTHTRFNTSTAIEANRSRMKKKNETRTNYNNNERTNDTCIYMKSMVIINNSTPFT